MDQLQYMEIFLAQKTYHSQYQPLSAVMGLEIYLPIEAGALAPAQIIKPFMGTILNPATIHEMLPYYTDFGMLFLKHGANLQ